MLLKKLKSQPLLLDASVLLVGVEKNEPNYSFSVMKELYLEALFHYFDKLLIHETVWNELDDSRKDFIDQFIGRNVAIVTEENLYGRDPIYTDIFNTIANFDLFKYRRGQTRNKGDVYSLAYAAYHKIPFISTRDGSIIKALEEINYLKNNVKLLGFEHILLLGFLNNNTQPPKRYKSIYKTYCTPAIKSGLIPETFTSFVKEQLNE
jgi:hypothetical protein